MGGQTTTAERRIARIADRDDGVVTRQELLGAGLSAREIERRLESGALLREYRGVYRVGHRAPSVDARYRAAVKACGDGAVLCGRAAGHLHRLLKGRAAAPVVLVQGKRKVEGLAVRRTRRLDPRDTADVRGIRVTTVPRTLVDLAGELDIEELARASHEAGVLHRTTPAQVKAVLARRPNAPGAGNLREVMFGHVPVTLSKLERGFVAVVREIRRPVPVTNRVASERRVDCRWPAHGLTVELDSYRFHNSRHSWEQDRRREREARLRGDEFRRFTYADVFEDRRYMRGELCALLPAAA